MTRTMHDLGSGLYPHVFNEIDQLVRILCAKPCDQTWANARVESISVHVRALLDFFRRKKNRRTDMLAREWGFDETPPNCTLRTRTDKDIAHLTWDRVGRYPDESSWSARDLVPLLEVSQRFVQHLVSTDRLRDRGDDWHSLNSRLKGIIRKLRSEAADADEK